MKQTLFNLQLFSDDAVETVSDPETTTEDKEQATEQKQTSEFKYTDEDVNKLIKQKKAEWQKQQQKQTLIRTL